MIVQVHGGIPGWWPGIGCLAIQYAVNVVKHTIALHCISFISSATKRSRYFEGAFLKTRFVCQLKHHTALVRQKEAWWQAIKDT